MGFSSFVMVAILHPMREHPIPIYRRGAQEGIEDPMTHPTPSVMAREAYPEGGLTNNCDTRVHYAAGIAAERARIAAWLRAPPHSQVRETFERTYTHLADSLDPRPRCRPAMPPIPERFRPYLPTDQPSLSPDDLTWARNVGAEFVGRTARDLDVTEAHAYPVREREHSPAADLLRRSAEPRDPWLDAPLTPDERAAFDAADDSGNAYPWD